MPTEYHRKLRAARVDAGYALDDVLVEMRVRLPKPMQTSKGTLQRIESEISEDKVDIHLVEFLCTLYGVEVRDVSPKIAEALQRFRDAVTALAANPDDRPFRSRCSAEFDQPRLPGFDGGVWIGAAPLLERLTGPPLVLVNA